MIKASVGPLGDAQVEVHGIPLENVNAFGVTSMAGDLTRLWIEILAPELEIEVDPSQIFYGYAFEEDT